MNKINTEKVLERVALFIQQVGVAVTTPTTQEAAFMEMQVLSKSIISRNHPIADGLTEEELQVVIISMFEFALTTIRATPKETIEKLGSNFRLLYEEALKHYPTKALDFAEHLATMPQILVAAHVASLFGITGVLCFVGFNDFLVEWEKFKEKGSGNVEDSFSA
jgi:hypothetical protein